MDKFERLMPATSSGQRMTLKIAFSYFFDYAVIAVLAVIYAVLDKILTPFAQHFSANNISLMYPIADPERVPIWVAMIYSCFIPAVIIAIYTLFIDGIFSQSKRTVARTQRYTWGDRLWELNCGILGLFLAQGAAFVITGSLKNLIGKPRPDLLARCVLDPETAQDPGPPAYGLLNRTLCTQTDSYILQDGFRSFPSGHSSSSFAGLFYLSLYLAAKLHVLDQRGEVWRTFIVIIPTLAAAMIAGSRIIDARHHPFDVMFGSALGILCGWAAYRQYFPPVSHTWEKGRAYPIRSWGVPLRRPNGHIGADGQFYVHSVSKVNSDAVPMVAGEEDDQTALVGVKPVFNQGYREADRPSFRTFQARGAQHGTTPTGSDDDTDYDQVRKQAGHAMMPSEGLSKAQPYNSIDAGASNVFREQLDRNHGMRGLETGNLGQEEMSK